MKHRILVTGGAGFIGSHLVDELIKAGHEVSIVDNFSTGRNSNVNTRASLHSLDISGDRGKIKDLFKRERFNYVFHLAAMARIPECLDKPIKSFRVNVDSTLWLLQTTREWGGAFIFSSSSAVYGETAEGAAIGEGHRLLPISLYGLHKLAAEQMTLMYHKFYGMKTVALRYFNVYGTRRQNPEGAYPNVVAAFDKGTAKGEITIYGDGEQKRDYVHVLDVVKANALWIDRDKGWGEAYNVGTGITTTVNEVADHFTANRKYEPAREGDPKWSCADNEKLQLLGWQPSLRFKEGIEYYKQT